jgi:dextranase
VGGIIAYHLLNFDGLSSLEWRDVDGSQNKPIIKENFTVTLPINQVNKITYTSPDWRDGVQKDLDFTITGGSCTVSIPYLEYWGVLIVE